jgi:hypothetical protein
VTVHVAVVSALEVSSESKAFHLSKETRVIGECILERAMLRAGLPHEDASAFFQYLRFDNSGVVRETRYITLASEDSVHRLAVAVRT